MYDDLKAYLDSLVHQFSVIGLSETWQNKTNVNAFPLLGYSNTGVTRKNKQGGGVTLYVSDSLQYRERADLSVNVEDVIESHFIEITSKPDCIIGIIYRPPNDKLDLFKNCLTEILEKIDSLNKKCFIMGDFNLDLLKIDGNQHIKDFIYQMFSSMFYPLISRPTRITNSTATVIDNIFVNNLEDSYKCGILFSDLSDHLPIFQITKNVQRAKCLHDKSKFRLISICNRTTCCPIWK